MIGTKPYAKLKYREVKGRQMACMGSLLVCKKLYAKAGNYEGNGCYIQVD